MDLQDYRRELDAIDDELLRLFCRRMDVAARIGAYKKEHGLPVLDAGREREILRKIAEKSPESMADDAVALYERIFELSRARQKRCSEVI